MSQVYLPSSMFPKDVHSRYERAVKLHLSIIKMDANHKSVDIVILRRHADQLDGLLRDCLDSEQHQNASEKLQKSAQDATQQIDIARENLERKAIIPVIAALVRAANTARDITAFFEFENEEKAKGISEDGPRRTRRTPGESTKPKQVNFPVSMADDMKAAAGARNESLSKWIVDACAERLRSEGGPSPVVIPLPADVSDSLRERIEDMADAFSKVVAELHIVDASRNDDEPAP